MKNGALVVNLYGGPGTGKSTGMAWLFSQLKIKGIESEIAPEFAKMLVWEERYKTLTDQIYVFGKQQKLLNVLKPKVDVIITDSPILLSNYYGENQSTSFKNLVIETYNSFNNFDVFLERVKVYSPNGRMQTEDEAKAIDLELQNILLNLDIHPYRVEASPNGYGQVLEKILEKLNGKD